MNEPCGTLGLEFNDFIDCCVLSLPRFFFLIYCLQHAILVSNFFFPCYCAGQPKRHLLTTGWSVFVSAKRLVAGDSVLFIW